MNCLLTPLMNSPTFITQGHWSERNLPSAPNFSRSAWNHETPQTAMDSSGNNDTVVMTPKEFSVPVKTKSQCVCRMVNRDWGGLHGSQLPLQAPDFSPRESLALCCRLLYGHEPGTFINSAFHPLVSVFNIKYLASIFNMDKWDDLDNYRLLSPTSIQGKIMKQLIQDAAKRSDERWCHLRKHGFMEKKKKNRTFQTGVAFLKKNTSFTEKGNIHSLPKGTWLGSSRKRAWVIQCQPWKF